MPEQRKPMNDVELAEFARKAHDQAVDEVAEEMGKELHDNLHRTLSPKKTERQPAATQCRSTG